MEFDMDNSEDILNRMRRILRDGRRPIIVIRADNERTELDEDDIVVTNPTIHARILACIVRPFEEFLRGENDND